ncbi:hypothetical protein F4680DRAFT_463278 [Xylaria scruposa]|nr:hypothetical protein F4680DRAFT_463278 [Xylaria scruposa]
MSNPQEWLDNFTALYPTEKRDLEQYYFLRGLYTDGGRLQAVNDLTDAGIIDSKCWEFVNKKLFATTKLQELNGRDWYLEDCPMYTLHNYCIVLKHLDSGGSVNEIPSNDLSRVLGEFRPLLNFRSHISTKKPVRSTTDNRDKNNQDKDKDKDKEDEDEEDDSEEDESKAIQRLENLGPTQYQDMDNDLLKRSAATDETTNVSFFVGLMNAIIDRSRDQTEVSMEGVQFSPDPFGPYQTRLACVPHRHAFIVGQRTHGYTACVDGYSLIPPKPLPTGRRAKKWAKKWEEEEEDKVNVDPATLGYILEVKKSRKGNPNLIFQTTAETSGWIYTRRKEYLQRLHVNNSPQYLPLIQVVGDVAYVCISKFHEEYVSYMASMKTTHPEQVLPEKPTNRKNYLDMVNYGPFQLMTDTDELIEFLKIMIAIDLTARKVR